MQDYFREDADRTFSALVLRYNTLSEEDDERQKLAGIIRERTRILLYMLPQRNLNIMEDDAAALFMDMTADVDRIIGAFRSSGLTYNGYLTQICHYKSKGYLKRKHAEEVTEKALLYSDIPIFECTAAEHHAEYRGQKENGIETMGMKELVHFMIAADGPEMNAEGAELHLQRLLHSKVTRRRFITLLLSLPETETAGFMAGISRVMRLDGRIISRFYMLRHEELEGNSAERDKAEEVAGRYWKTMARLRHAIATETDEEKISGLMRAYERAREIYHKRREIVMRSRHGLSQRSISELLDIPRSTVSNDICRMKELLQCIKT